MLICCMTLMACCQASLSRDFITKAEKAKKVPAISALPSSVLMLSQVIR